LVIISLAMIRTINKDGYVKNGHSQIVHRKAGTGNEKYKQDSNNAIAERAAESGKLAVLPSAKITPA